MMVSTGRLAAEPFSRLSNLLTVRFPASLPISIQPKLLDGSSSHLWTLATSWDVDPQA